ncbi:MAG: hypothetical protein ABWY57_00460, partial [Mycetocola sp.]
MFLLLVVHHEQVSLFIERHDANADRVDDGIDEAFALLRLAEQRLQFSVLSFDLSAFSPERPIHDACEDRNRHQHESQEEGADKTSTVPIDAQNQWRDQREPCANHR